MASYSLCKKQDVACLSDVSWFASNNSVQTMSMTSASLSKRPSLARTPRTPDFSEQHGACQECRTGQASLTNMTAVSQNVAVCPGKVCDRQHNAVKVVPNCALQKRPSQRGCASESGRHSSVSVRMAL